MSALCSAPLRLSLASMIAALLVHGLGWAGQKMIQTDTGMVVVQTPPRLLLPPTPQLPERLPPPETRPGEAAAREDSAILLPAVLVSTEGLTAAALPQASACTVRFDIDAGGRAQGIAAACVDDQLKAEAERAIRTSDFLPARRNGQPVAQKDAVYEVAFILR